MMFKEREERLTRPSRRATRGGPFPMRGRTRSQCCATSHWPANLLTGRHRRALLHDRHAHTPGGGPGLHRHDFKKIVIILDGEIEAMPFFLTLPISWIMPITSSGMPNSINVANAPSPAAGKVDRMVSGWIMLSYSMPRMM